MRRATVILGLVALLAGCGGGGGNGSGRKGPAGSTTLPAAFKNPAVDQFPTAAGKTLQQLANQAQAPINLGLATSVYTPGENRLAFGLIDQAQQFTYGPTVVYVGRGPNSPARGPYPAPLDGMIPSGPFRSRGVSGSDPKAIYAARIPLSRTGRTYVLALVRNGGRLLGATTAIDVKRSTAVPGRGDRAPRISTPTFASVGGVESKIDTRLPPDRMHEVDFKDVVGRKPVALIFSTPQLCESRVCGPVTDVAAELQDRYGDRVTFIHQEIFVDNDAKKGYVPQMRAFNLPSEPWLFTFDRRGRVVERLEGAFGFDEFERAVRRAAA